MTEDAVSAARSTPPRRQTEVAPAAASAEEGTPGRAAHPPLTAEDLRAVEHLVTEDDTPVDNRFSGKQRRLLTSPLYSSWSGPGRGRPFMVCAGVGLFLHPREAPLVPDVLLSLDVEEIQDPWVKEGRSYFIWVYKKPPDVAIEIVSHEKAAEMEGKFAAYARFGLPCYVIYDPWKLAQDQPVRAFQLSSAGTYTPCPHRLLPGIELGLQLWNGRFENLEATWLRWRNASGALLPIGEELVAQAARDRAGQAASNAAAESNRAARERTRADRLAALLRAHGISPDNDNSD